MVTVKQLISDIADTPTEVFFMSGCGPARHVVYRLKTPFWGRGAAVSLDGGKSRVCPAGKPLFSLIGRLEM